ncbi:MAG: hypothetical protein ABFD89_25960 [Bryobacteraceae bacterium]
MNTNRRVFLGLAAVPAANAIQTALAKQGELRFHNVACPGGYPGHLQGVCTNERDAIYWPFTEVLVKTDAEGKILKTLQVRSHHGDLCYHDGKIYVAVNFGLFNDAQKRADSWVYVYDAGDLSLFSKHAVPELVYGAGGMAYRKGRFFVVGGLPEGFEENYVYEYDRKFRFIKRHVVKSGYTYLGIQTAAYSDGYWWFGCYGEPKILLKVSEDFSTVRRFEFDCSLGIVPVAKNTFLIAKGRGSRKQGHSAELLLADADEQKGLVVRPA